MECSDVSVKLAARAADSPVHGARRRVTVEHLRDPLRWIDEASVWTYDQIQQRERCQVAGVWLRESVEHRRQPSLVGLEACPGVPCDQANDRIRRADGFHVRSPVDRVKVGGVQGWRISQVMKPRGCCNRRRRQAGSR